MTEKIKITKKFVESVSFPGSGQKILWDDDLPGFGIRLTPGSVSYICQGRIKGRTKRITIGRHGLYFPETARRKARQMLMDMSNNIDPAAQKKITSTQKMTLTDITNNYIEKKELKESTVQTILKHLNTTFKEWQDLPLVDLTRDMVINKFERMQKTPYQANQAFRHLRAIINYTIKSEWAGNKPIFEINPVDALRGCWYTTKARENHIEPEQVGQAWAIIQDLRAKPENRKFRNTALDIISFLLFTGARSGEARLLRWDDLDLVKMTWHVADPKNREPITRPLCRQIIDVLGRRDQSTGWVFPGVPDKNPIKDFRYSLNDIAGHLYLDLCPHDLRRTFTGVAFKAGVELWRVKLLMGHSVPAGEVALKHYSELKNLEYMRADIQRIGDWIEAEAEGHREQPETADDAAENVIKFKAKNG